MPAKQLNKLNFNSLKAELKNFSSSPIVTQFSKHWTEYEVKVKDLVKDLNLRSRDARGKSKQQLDKFTDQIKTARTQVEKAISEVVNQEAKVLNKAFGDLVTYLKSISKNEKIVEASKATKPKKTTAAAVKTTKLDATKKTAKTAKAKGAKRSTSKTNGRGNNVEVSPTL